MVIINSYSPSATDVNTCSDALAALAVKLQLNFMIYSPKPEPSHYEAPIGSTTSQKMDI